MGRALRAYEFAELVMWYGKDRIKYQDALEVSREYVSKRPKYRFSLSSHVGDQYVAEKVAETLLRGEKVEF